MDRLMNAIDRYLNALARTPGEEFSHGLHVYRLIEHPREMKPAPLLEMLGHEDTVLRRAS